MSGLVQGIEEEEIPETMFERPDGSEGVELWPWVNQVGGFSILFFESSSSQGAGSWKFVWSGAGAAVECEAMTLSVSGASGVVVGRCFLVPLSLDSY